MNTAHLTVLEPSPARPPKRFPLWLWVALPLAALSMLALPLTFLYVTVKGSGAYDTSLAYLNAEPGVHAALGSPVKSGFLPMFNVRLLPNGAGEADFTFSLQGSRDSGSLHVHSMRTDNLWRVDRAELSTHRGTLALLPTH